MAISATFYKNNKRVNSTKLPTASAGTFAVSVELKDATNLFTPSLTLSVDHFIDGTKITNPMQYNYCYIADFNRYYFVRSWSWILGRWSCDLEIDVLASFRTEIGNTTARVLRSASECNPYIVDSKYETTSTVKSDWFKRDSPWYTDLRSSSPAQGFFVVGIVNNDSNGIGATSYYAVDGVGLRSFISDMYSSPSWLDITDTSISNDLQKILINPIQYVTSCQWIPCNLVGYTQLASVTTIPVGWWTRTVSSSHPFYRLSGSSLVLHQQTTVTIPKHRQYTENANLQWLNNSPYTQYQLQYYPFGVFPIDSSKLINHNELYLTVDVDLITGMAVLSITRAYAGEQPYEVIYSASAQLGVPISVAQMSLDTSRFKDIPSLIMSAGMALTANNVVSNVVDKVTEIGNAIAERKPLLEKPKYNYHALSAQQRAEIGSGWAARDEKPLEAFAEKASSIISTVAPIGADIGNAILASAGVCKTSGANGALAPLTLPIILIAFQYEIVSPDPVHYGYPLCANRRINALSGFTLCANDGDLTMAATPLERQAVVSFMTGGFYYE